MGIETEQKMSDQEKLINIFKTIEDITLQTSDPDEIRKALQALPNFDIGGLSLDAEIYYALAMRLSYSPRPDEEMIEADLVAISTLQRVIRTLGDSVDISYFEIQPKGKDFQRFRKERTSAMKAALRLLEI